MWNGVVHEIGCAWEVKIEWYHLLELFLAAFLRSEFLGPVLAELARELLLLRLVGAMLTQIVQWNMWSQRIINWFQIEDIKETQETLNIYEKLWAEKNGELAWERNT